MGPVIREFLVLLVGGRYRVARSKAGVHVTQPEHVQTGDGRDAKRKQSRWQQVEFHLLGLMQEMLPMRSYVNAPVKLTVWLVVTSGGGREWKGW